MSNYIPDDVACYHVEREILMRWRRFQSEVWTTQEDAECIAFSQGTGEPVQSSNISDKTARGAFLLDSIDEKRKWLDCVTEALEWMKDERPEWYSLLYGHYGMKYSRGYKRKYAKSFTESYCKVRMVGRETYRQQRLAAIKEIVSYARFKGLLRNCKQFNQWLSAKKR